MGRAVVSSQSCSNPAFQQATRCGEKLLLGTTCSRCSSTTGGLGAAASELLEMVDVRLRVGVAWLGLSVNCLVLDSWTLVRLTAYVVAGP